MRRSPFDRDGNFPDSHVNNAEWIQYGRYCDTFPEYPLDKRRKNMSRGLRRKRKIRRLKRLCRRLLRITLFAVLATGLFAVVYGKCDSVLHSSKTRGRVLEGKKRQMLTEMLRAAGDAGYDYWIASGNANMDASQAEEPANQWLVIHCSEYGFILRYPLDKVSVTKIAWEPW